MKALIDSGASGNFISSALVGLRDIPTRRKDQVYELELFQGKGWQVNQETLPVPCVIQKHHEEIVLDVVFMKTHDVVLGIPWLRKHNPAIDWTRGVLRMKKHGLVTQLNLTQWQRSPVNEGEQTLRAAMLGHPKQDDSARRSDSTSDPMDHKDAYEQVRVPKEIDTSLKIPEQYKEWEFLFQEEEGEAALPKNQPWDHEIKLKPGTEPGFGPIYKLSEPELEATGKYIQENLRKGFIRESTSPARYPITFAPKKDGSRRLCVDYRKLNDITIKNRYPLPNTKELQDRTTGATIFTILDQKSAYNLIRIKPGDEWKTAFGTRYGHYEYLVMPFGLTNAPATCQALINNTLREYLDRFVVAYLDDILIYSKTEEEHRKHVKRVLKALAKVNLRLNPNKCHFHQKKVMFVGHLISKDGIQSDPEKVRAVQEWPVPTTVKEVQAFLGFANYNRDYVPMYSQKANPLTELTKKDTLFKWGEAQQQAFESIKESLGKNTLLKTFQGNQPTKMETDASDKALGGCILQRENGKWRPIAYYSRKFTPAELNYDIHDKELLAIVASLKHWRVYAESSSELDIYTDHKNLLNFTTTKTLNRRQVRWAEELGQYKFRIHYTPGKENGRADALSRRPDYMQGHEQTQATILRQEADGTLVPNQQFNMTNVAQDDNDLIRAHHDPPTYGHPGVRGTMDAIKQRHQVPELRRKVEEYIKQCIHCQRNKPNRHLPYGKAQAHRIPQNPWDDITMDFITQLPKSKDPCTHEDYTAILVIVDRLTKYTIMVPCKEDISAPKLGFLLVDRLIRDHGIPKRIVSDRDKLFTSAYWKTLLGQMGTTLGLSTAYHPRTDGQTERANQCLEEYLRHYVSNSHDNWVSLLPVAQLALNNHKSSTTKVSPFLANFGRTANLDMQQPIEGQISQDALEKTKEMNDLYQKLKQRIEEVDRKSMTQQNKKRMNGPQLKEGDKVYLRTKNLTVKKPRTKKLDHKKIGPFRISKIKGPVNYQLELPADAKIHNTFHVSLLEPAHPNTPTQQHFHYEPEEEDVFTVEKILAKGPKGYLIKWRGYPHSENTWEPLKNLLTCQQLLRQFHQRNQGTKKRTSQQLLRGEGRQD